MSISLSIKIILSPLSDIIFCLLLYNTNLMGERDIIKKIKVFQINFISNSLIK